MFLKKCNSRINLWNGNMRLRYIYRYRSFVSIIVEHNKCSVGVLFTNTWQQSKFTLRGAHQHYMFMNSKHHKIAKVMFFKSPFNCFLVVTRREICIRTQAVCAKRVNVERWHVKCLNFQQRCCFHIAVTTDVR